MGEGLGHALPGNFTLYESGSESDKDHHTTISQAIHCMVVSQVLLPSELAFAFEALSQNSLGSCSFVNFRSSHLLSPGEVGGECPGVHTVSSQNSRTLTIASNKNSAKYTDKGHFTKAYVMCHGEHWCQVKMLYWFVVIESC